VIKLSDKFTPSKVATSTTVVNGRIILTAAARRGQKVYLGATSAALFGPVQVGMFVTGTGIPADTKVTDVASTSSITISDAATDSGTDALDFFGTDRFLIKCEARGAAFSQDPFVPCFPIVVSDVGQAAYFTLDVSTTGRFSVAYLYGP
jgi:hypothetical protein